MVARSRGLYYLASYYFSRVSPAPEKNPFMKIPSVLLALVIACPVSWAGPAETPGDDAAQSLLALPILSYTTDTGFGYGAAGVCVYQSGAARPSQALFSAMYTTKHQAAAVVQIEHYTPDGRHRLFGKVAYNRFPSDFFGLGNNTENDDPGSYTPEYLSAELSASRDLGYGLWIRGGGFFRNQSLIERADGDAVRAPGVPWGTGRMDAGALAGIFRDTRDNSLAATRGMFAFLKYSRSLYQDHGDGFGSLSLDLRVFRSPRPGWVLASHLWAEGVTGDCPFYFLPNLGGQDHLRGYEAYRFTARNALLIQQDVRFPVWWNIGGCVFAAAGRVADDRRDLLSGKFHAAYGAGLRYAFDTDKGMVLRADYAAGNDATGTYITFGEAF